MVESVSTIINVAITGGDILDEDLAIYGILGKNLAIESVSSISNLKPLQALSLFEWTELWFLPEENNLL